MDLSRHTPIIKPWEHPAPITIIGVGATGSKIAMALVALGFTNLRCYDFDVVEEHNLPNQAYLHQHIGMLKVEALAELAKMKTGETDEAMKFVNAKIPAENCPIEGYVFLLTDTIESRTTILNECLKGNDKVLKVIETRMASTHGNINVFDPNNMLERRAWEKSLPSEEHAEVSPCGTSISVGVTAELIANMAVWQFLLLLQNDGLESPRLDLYCKPTIVRSHTWE